MLAIKVVKIDSKINISLPWSKLVKQKEQKKELLLLLFHFNFSGLSECYTLISLGKGQILESLFLFSCFDGQVMVNIEYYYSTIWLMMFVWYSFILGSQNVCFSGCWGRNNKLAPKVYKLPSIEGILHTTGFY